LKDRVLAGKEPFVLPLLMALVVVNTPAIGQCGYYKATRGKAQTQTLAAGNALPLGGR